MRRTAAVSFSLSHKKQSENDSETFLTRSFQRSAASVLSEFWGLLPWLRQLMPLAASLDWPAWRLGPPLPPPPLFLLCPGFCLVTPPPPSLTVD